MSLIESARFYDLLADDRVETPEWASMPIGDRIADRLGDLMYYTDDALGLLHDERASSMRWIETDLRKIYTDIDRLMKKMTD